MTAASVRGLARSSARLLTGLRQRRCAWEISIKRALGKLKAPASLDASLDEAGFERLDIAFAHASAPARCRLYTTIPSTGC
jgi:hypothetical protein